MENTVDFVVNDDSSFEHLKGALDDKELVLLNNVNGLMTLKDGMKVIKIQVDPKYVSAFSIPANVYNSTIYGKSQMERIVNISVKNGETYIYQEDEVGKLVLTKLPFKHWVLSPKLYQGFKPLKGKQHFNHIAEFTDEEFQVIKPKVYQKNLYTVWSPAENYMIKNGFTYFKGMKLPDVSVLSFDIETTGLTHDSSSRVLLISNTFRNKGVVVRKLFSLDEYNWDDRAMIASWCKWVQAADPSLLIGHNIFGYDLGYLNYCTKGAGLPLGRDGSLLEFAKNPSQKRKDGSQSYTYHNVTVFGRDVIDTMFLAINYDLATKKYVSFGLKQIIKQEGLEKKDRVFYDASKIRDNFQNEVEREKIKSYAIDDADDALSLFDLMAPSFFYFTQSVSKTFQQMINSATGAQINNMMVRAYLQDGESIAQASQTRDFGGGISLGIPGLYKNAFKQDVSSLYPSIMRQYQVYDKNKDPKKYFIYMVEHFTVERLKNKKLAKETKDVYYKDLQESQKIAINSMYGFLGSQGLNYNSPDQADFVTARGRDILEKAIMFATSQNLEFWENRSNEANGIDPEEDGEII